MRLNLTQLNAIPSRLFYACDVLVGMFRKTCPNCDLADDMNPVVWRRHRGAVLVRQCASCGVCYRPTGFRSGSPLALYYSHLYSNAGIGTATDWAMAEDLGLRIQQAGKDRSSLLKPLLGELPKRATICVLGCSWGYEMLPLNKLGCSVVGIELSRPRREFGVSQLGLSIYENEVKVRAELGYIDLVLSSHVLEHIPRASDLLDRVVATLRPRVEVHITPCVETIRDDATAAIIGREHPIGITSGFWKQYAKHHRAEVEVSYQGVEPGNCGETVAVLRHAIH